MQAGESQRGSDTNRGVSPVIGVILMVAIAVILAAVVGAFALGFTGENQEPAPVVTAELDRGVTTGTPGITDGSERIALAHEGGDAVPLSDIRVSTEVRCFDDTLLVDNGKKRGGLTNLPLDSTRGIQDKNVVRDEIFMRGTGAVEKPLSGSADTTWDAGERLVYHIDDSKCSVPDAGEVTVEVIHEPSNGRIVEESLGSGFDPSFEDEIEPATAGSTSTHTWFLDLQKGDYGDPKADDVLGDEVEEITVNYDPNNNGVAGSAFDGLDQDDVTVTMTRSLSGGLDRSGISVNSDSYGGADATFDLSGGNNKDVEGPIEIEIDGITNPGSSGTYDVEIVLKNNAGTITKTISKTLEIGD